MASRASAAPEARGRTRRAASPAGTATTSALAAALGERLVPNAAVEGVARERGSWVVRHSGGVTTAGALVVAVPAGDAARLVRPLASGAADALEAISHPPLAVVHLSFPIAAFRRPPEGFGHLVVPREGRRVLGAVWPSSLFPGRAPEGKALFCAFVGGSRDPAAPSLSDAALFAIAASDLRDSLGATAAPALVAVRRYARSIPQYTGGHGARIAAIAGAERALPGLRLIGSYRGGVSVGDVVESAQRAAGAILDP